MTNTASAGDEPATDLDSIITSALAERGDGDAANAAGAEDFTAATASDASASESASAAPSGDPSPAAEPASPMQPIEPPARWTPDKKASFATWPRDVQEAVVAREQRARGRLHAQDPGRRGAQENCRASSESDQAVRSLFERAGSGHRSDPRHDDREPARRRIPASQRRSAEEGEGPPRHRCVLRDRSCGTQPWGAAGGTSRRRTPTTSNCVNHSGRSNSASRRPSR